MTLDAKKWGAFYTCDRIASYLASWAIRSGSDHVLEPSFGNGVFLGIALERIQELGGNGDHLFAVELREEPFTSNSAVQALPAENCFQQNFLQIKPFPVDAVIGNPPYIRLRNLDLEVAKQAINCAETKGVCMSPNGSLWMPFILHAMSFLKPGGRLALVLPFEITYVKYAVPLWVHLAQSFAKIQIIRTYEDIFPNNEEETILLLAEGYGEAGQNINYQVFGTKQDLFRHKRLISTTIPLDQLTSLQKPFLQAHLSQNQQDLINRLITSQAVAPLGTHCKFKIGYVSGDKHFFHPSNKSREAYALPQTSFRKAVINSRQLKGVGLSLESNALDTELYYPAQPTLNDQQYIAYGEDNKVDQRYKCRVRKPWYLTPGLEVPDLLLTVFTECPLLVANTGQYLASNSLLCGFIKDPKLTPRDILCQWYNSFVLLSVELNIHSLGGGVLVLIPGEVDKILAPRLIQNHVDQTRLLRAIDGFLKAEQINQAYEIGDQYVLQQLLGLAPSQVDELRNAIAALRSWRNSSLRKKRNAKRFN